MQSVEQCTGLIGCPAVTYRRSDGECIETVVAVRNEHGGVGSKRIEMNAARLAPSRMRPDFKTTLSAIPANCLRSIALTCLLLPLHLVEGTPGDYVADSLAAPHRSAFAEPRPPSPASMPKSSDRVPTIKGCAHQPSHNRPGAQLELMSPKRHNQDPRGTPIGRTREG